MSGARSTSGLTFLDNSDLSVCEKIKLYFAQQTQPVYTNLQDSTSSSHNTSSSSSVDLDASFQQLLAIHKRQKQRPDPTTTTSTVVAAVQRSISPVDMMTDQKQLIDETIIDLCSPPTGKNRAEAASTPPAQRRNAASVAAASPNLTAYHGTVFHMSPAQSSVRRDLLNNNASPDSLKEGQDAGDDDDDDDEDGISQLDRTIAATDLSDDDVDDSLGVAVLDDTAIIAQTPPTTAWQLDETLPIEARYADYSDSRNNWLQVSDESFVEQERLCRAADANMAEHTMLGDVEEPSNFWDDTMCATLLQHTDDEAADNVCTSPAAAAAPSRRATGLLRMRSRVSTIPEESTINSSSGSAASGRRSANDRSADAKSVCSNVASGPKPDTPAIGSSSKHPGSASSGTRTLSSSSSSSSSSYRPSFFNVFPKRRAARKFLVDPEEENDDDGGGGACAEQLPMQTVKQRPSPSAPPAAPIQTTELRSSSPRSGVLTVRNAIVEPIASTAKDTWFKRQMGQQTTDDSQKVLAKPKQQPERAAAAPRRESMPLITFDDTLCDVGEDDCDDDSNATDEDALNNALPQFNDTIEAMDYYMEKGRELRANSNTTPAPQHQQHQPPIVFSPKSASRTPDTIRRRLLVRNFMRSSGASPQLTGRSGRPEDSFEGLE